MIKPDLEGGEIEDEIVSRPGQKIRDILDRPVLPEQELLHKYTKLAVNWPVFIISSLLIFAIVLWVFIEPNSATAVLSNAVSVVTGTFGWFYVLTATAVVVFMLALAFSKAGKIRLGPNSSRPAYSLFSWGCMLFAAGIGIDLLFFSVAEPLSQYYAPPQGTGMNPEAARQAVVLTIFHYGITGWALYALMGLAFALFAFRYHLPLAIRSALFPLLGRRIQGGLGDTVDIAAILGTVFGVATSLGIGVVQLNTGLKFAFGLEQGLSIQLALIVMAVGTATVSALAGIDKGIKRLCEFNVWLAIVLLIYMLATGNLPFILSASITDFGSYFVSFPGLSVETYAYSANPTWMQQWTIFFWAWWIAWAPFVGIFLARISRGRTLRQFIGGTLLVPLCFVASWICVFGNAALEMAVGNKIPGLADTVVNAPELAFYQLLQQYPFAPFVIGLAIVVGLLLFVTSANSAALVMSNFCCFIPDVESDGPPWMRIFWAVLTGALTIGMLLLGGIPTLQNATILAGIPFALVIYAIMYGIFAALRWELGEKD